MEITGFIKVLKEEQQVSAAFKKRELVITTEEQYPQHILIEFHQDKCEYLDDYAEGEQVKVGINVRGREWTSPQGEVKYFNSFQGWKIERFNQKQEDAGQFNPPPMNNNPQEIKKDYAPTNGEEKDDLPF